MNKIYIYIFFAPVILSIIRIWQAELFNNTFSNRIFFNHADFKRANTRALVLLLVPVQSTCQCHHVMTSDHMLIQNCSPFQQVHIFCCWLSLTRISSDLLEKVTIPELFVMGLFCLSRLLTIGLIGGRTEWCDRTPENETTTSSTHCWQEPTKSIKVSLLAC